MENRNIRSVGDWAKLLLRREKIRTLILLLQEEKMQFGEGEDVEGEDKLLVARVALGGTRLLRDVTCGMRIAADTLISLRSFEKVQRRFII